MSNKLGRVVILLLSGLLAISGWAHPVHCQDISFQLATPVTAETSDWEEGEIPSGGYDSCDYGGKKTLFLWSYGEGGSESHPAHGEPLLTDRPDFTEASSTVGRGIAQLEFGYTYVFDNDGTNSVTSHSFPETLLRYGIFADWLEARVGWNYAEEKTRTGGASMTVNGAEDLYLGFKIGLTPQEGILPEMALIPQMTVPTGSAPFNNNQVLPGVNWIYGWEINDFISTAGSSQFNRVLDEVTSDNYVEFAQSWTIGYALCERLGAYTEWFAFFPSGADTAKPQHFFNGGFAFLASDNIQLDVRAGVGLNDAADDYFVGSGASVRF